MLESFVLEGDPGGSPTAVWLTLSGFLACCLHKVTWENGKRQNARPRRRDQVQRSCCKFNELVANCCLQGPHSAMAWACSLPSSQLPGPSLKAPGVPGEARLQAVGRGGSWVQETLLVRCSREAGRQGCTSGHQRSHVLGWRKTPPPLPGLMAFQRCVAGLWDLLMCKRRNGPRQMKIACPRHRAGEEVRAGTAARSYLVPISVLREAPVVPTKIQATFSESEDFLCGWPCEW